MKSFKYKSDQTPFEHLKLGWLQFLSNIYLTECSNSTARFARRRETPQFPSTGSSKPSPEEHCAQYLTLLMLPVSDPSLHRSSWLATIWRSASSSRVSLSNCNSWKKTIKKINAISYTETGNQTKKTVWSKGRLGFLKMLNLRSRGCWCGPEEGWGFQTDLNSYHSPGTHQPQGLE